MPWRVAPPAPFLPSASATARKNSPSLSCRRRWYQSSAATATKSLRDVREALRGGRPRVVLVTGVGSVAVDDVRSQLREAEAEVALEVVRVAVTRPAEV